MSYYRKLGGASDFGKVYFCSLVSIICCEECEPVLRARSINKIHVMLSIGPAMSIYCPTIFFFRADLMKLKNFFFLVTNIEF